MKQAFTQSVQYGCHWRCVISHKRHFLECMLFLLTQSASAVQATQAPKLTREVRPCFANTAQASLPPQCARASCLVFVLNVVG